MDLDAVGVCDTAWTISGMRRKYLKKYIFLLLPSGFEAGVCYY